MGQILLHRGVPCHSSGTAMNKARRWGLLGAGTGFPDSWCQGFRWEILTHLEILTRLYLQVNKHSGPGL